MKQQRLRKKKGPPDYVTSYNELARRLGRSRKSILRWRKRFENDPELPFQRGDRHSVSAWLRFMRLRGLFLALDQDKDDKSSKAYWDRERSRLEFEKSRFEFEIQKGLQVPIPELGPVVTRMLSGFRTALNMMPGTAARWLVGLRDYHEIKAKLQSEIDVVLGTLGRAKPFADIAAESFPDRSPSERAEIVAATERVVAEIARLCFGELSSETQ